MATKEVSLVIENPTEGNFLKRIDWNKREFMELVASVMSQYEDIIFTESEMKEAKNVRAKLNAMKKAISDRRIQIKNEIMKPYNIFETEVKEVVVLIDRPIECIDKQIKEYEEKAKAEKYKALTDYFVEIAADLDNIFTFNMIFEQKYLNATISLKKSKEDIENKVNRIKDDMKTIDSMDEDIRLIAKNIYSRVLDMSKTMTEVTRIQELKKKEEKERLLRERKEKVVVEATQKEAENVIGIVKNTTKAEESILKPKEIVLKGVTDQVALKDTKKYKTSFTVYGTKEQIMTLKEYMLINHIDFRKVEK